MPIRLFIAAELPSEVTAAAGAVGDALRAHLARTAPRARLTWVAPDRMHLTVRFLGDVSAEREAVVRAAMEAPFRQQVFRIRLGSAGIFPPRGAPRVIWVGFAEGEEPFVALAEELSQRLDSAGFRPEARPFRPHLTLARVREPGGLRAPAVLEHPVIPGDAAGIVDAITLFESRLSPRGPTYTALQRTPLRRA